MSAATVTFIIATYKRVDALKATLQSLIYQDYQNWEALVIGDCCEEETAIAIRLLNDKRIKYYNLPQRFGEQSGPNSFGLNIAEGDYVSFLNHDDILLQDHLKYALEVINAESADFFIGSSANAKEIKSQSGKVIPVFTEVLPQYRDLRYLVEDSQWLFDPSSFWLIKTSFAKSVGSWYPAKVLWRTPLRNWIMRSWRKGGRFALGEKVTGLRFWTQNLRKGSSIYNNTTPEHQFIVDFLRTKSAEEIRNFIGWGKNYYTGIPSLYNLEKPVAIRRRAFMAFLYRYIGIDALSVRSRIKGLPKGELLQKITRKRINKDLPELWDVISASEEAEIYREV